MLWSYLGLVRGQLTAFCDMIQLFYVEPEISYVEISVEFGFGASLEDPDVLPEQDW